MNESIKHLSDTIKRLEAENEQLIDSYHAELCRLSSGFMVLKMHIDRIARDVLPMESVLNRLSQIEKTQIKNTASRKKFEAGYWNSMGE